MDYSTLTGRQLIIESVTNDSPEFRAAFNAAILDGKFQGMTQACFEAIKADAENMHRPMAFAA